MTRINSTKDDQADDNAVLSTILSKLSPRTSALLSSDRAQMILLAVLAVCSFDVDLEGSTPAVETWSAKPGDTDSTAFISSITDLSSRGVLLRPLVKQA